MAADGNKGNSSCTTSRVLDGSGNTSGPGSGAASLAAYQVQHWLLVTATAGVASDCYFPWERQPWLLAAV